MPARIALLVRPAFAGRPCFWPCTGAHQRTPRWAQVVPTGGFFILQNIRNFDARSVCSRVEIPRTKQAWRDEWWKKGRVWQFKTVPVPITRKKPKSKR